ncbi:MAG: addiction module protein, partial [Propionibacteriaceae bacterium]|nr:addiction module protein [Propionibacteriaceae bacterium]
PHDRAALANAMLESLDGDCDDPAEVNAAWTKEIGSRLDDLISGRVQGVSLDQMKASSAAALAAARQ